MVIRTRYAQYTSDPALQAAQKYLGIIGGFRGNTVTKLLAMSEIMAQRIIVKITEVMAKGSLPQCV